MKKKLLGVLAFAFLAVFLFFGWSLFSFNRMQTTQFTRPEFAISEEVAKADVELGKRIFHVRAGCVDCHGANLAGAKIVENGPLGVIYGANISSSALKSWTDEEIAAAIRYGIHKEGRSLRFMPSFDYFGLSLSDTAALIAYLRSTEPVNTPSGPVKFGPVAKIMTPLGKMPVVLPAHVIDMSKGFGEKPEEGPTVEFGRYLVNSCTGCHGAELRGGPIPGGDPAWPIAPSARLGANPIWTEVSFREMLRSGISPISREKIKPPMPIELLKQMNETETTAMWLYLSSLK